MIATTTTPLTPAEHADTAAEAVRALNHATQQASGISPPDVASTLGSLALLNHRQGQAFTQLARALIHSIDSYDLYDDTGRDPADTVATAGRHLTVAAALTAQLAHQLDQAHTAASHLGYHPLDDDQDDQDIDQGIDQVDPVLW